MKMRTIAFSLLLLLSFLVPWWLLLPLAALYALRFPAYELLFLGAFIDTTAGISGPLGLPAPFLYTAVAAVLVALGYFARPYFMFGGTQKHALMENI
jgi:hypothetical protein